MNIKTASDSSQSITLDLEALNYLCLDEVEQGEIMQVIKPTLFHLIRLKMDDSWPLKKIVEKYTEHLQLVEKNPDLSEVDVLYRIPIKTVLNYLLGMMTDEDLLRTLTTH